MVTTLMRSILDFETDVFMARIMINTKELIAKSATYVPQELPLPPMNFYGIDLDGAGGEPIETDPTSRMLTV